MIPSKGSFISISGPIGAGKSSVSDLLLTEFPGFKRGSFAFGLKKDVSEYFDIPMHELTNPLTKGKYRWLLQQFGTDICRRYDADWWVKRFSYYFSGYFQVVVDDMRFMNEYWHLKSQGYAMVRLMPTYDRTWEYLTKIQGMTDDQAEEAINHESEHSLEGAKWDYVIEDVSSPQASYESLCQQLGISREAAA